MWTFKEYYKNNKEQRNKAVARNVKRLRAKRAKIVAEYKGKPCLDCGKLYPSYVMDFDHRPGEKKLGDICRLLQQGWSWERMKTEMDKCDVVCSNCHRERTHQRRIQG